VFFEVQKLAIHGPLPEKMRGISVIPVRPVVRAGVANPLCSSKLIGCIRNIQFVEW